MPPEQEFFEVQLQVFNDQIEKLLAEEVSLDTENTQHAKSAEERFVTENGLPFRLFAEHLSPPARAVWDRYTHGDSDALYDLEEAYTAFKKELIAHIHEDDPKESAAFRQAIEDGDIDTASRIIAAHAGFLDERIAE